MDSAFKSKQLNLNNVTKQAQRKEEEQRAYERIHKELKTIDARRTTREQDT